MSNDKKETFFPGVRKPLILDNIDPLATGAGEKRIKLDFIMDLSDNQVLGIPEWLEDAIDLVRRADSGSQLNQSIVELDGVILRFYGAADDDKPYKELQGVLLKKFTVRRSSKETPSGELADSELFFVAYTWWSEDTWDWAGRNFNRTVLCSFGTTQAKLTFGPPKKDGKPEGADQNEALPFDGKSAAANDHGVVDDEESDPERVFSTQEGETDEEARKRALDPKRDSLFAVPKSGPAAPPPAKAPRKRASKHVN